ncbi:MAG: family 16 glycoside hydrolase [Verrucomicrobiales bacterium]
MLRAITFLLIATGAVAEDEDHATLIFADDFNRSESQEVKDEPGNGWKTNSKSRAKGNKQVDLKDGALHIYIHEEADHGVSVVHDAQFRDGAVGLRFKLEAKGDSLGLNFADPQCKEVHAGHLFAARIHLHRVLLEDLKTGKMDLQTRQLRKAGKLSDSQKLALKKKEKSIPNKLEVGRWYELMIEVDGKTLKASIDGEEIGSFTSEGIAHPSKRLLRLAVPKNAVVDDLKIWRHDG